jgi:ubiquinone/menaquinone biosynthesis C-methylase UbiE
MDPLALAKTGIRPAMLSRAAMEGGILQPCPEPGSDPMSDMAMMSTGHMASGASWLDAHFESARPKYEDALRFVEIGPGWTVLDAGCGAGGYVPLLCELVGAAGRVSALDLAPENIEYVERLVSEANGPASVDLHVGSVLELPFADAAFDCVWCANVAAYLTAAEFARVMGEFRV